MKKGIVQSKELRFLLTQRCNYDCVFCNHEGLYQSTTPQLTPDDIVYLFTVCKNNLGWQTTSLTGGEPLVYPHFDQVVQGIAAENGIMTVISNGELLDKHLDAVALLNRVNISLHSLNEGKYHQLVRREQKLSKVIKNIDLVKAKAPQVDVRLNVVLTKNFNDSPRDVQALLDFADQHGCSIKFIELANNKDKIVPLNDIIMMLQQVGAAYRANVNHKKILLTHRNTDIYLTRTTCEHARLQTDPEQACFDNLDLNITPAGTILNCYQTNEQTHLLDEIKARKDDAVVTKLSKFIYNKLGTNCPLVKNPQPVVDCTNERI